LSSDATSGEDWVAGRFVKMSDDTARVYLSSEPGLFVEFRLDDVQRCEKDATRVFLKPDRGAVFNFSWTGDPDADGDDFELCVRRGPDLRGTYKTFISPIFSKGGYSTQPGCPKTSPEP
jgi:hypothetical protein